jgi:hypothetical protein
MERLEPEHIFRNQQVAGSIPAGGSIKIKQLLRKARVTGGTLGGTLPNNPARPRRSNAEPFVKRQS